MDVVHLVRQIIQVQTIVCHLVKSLLLGMKDCMVFLIR
jgi:hypothetical protein